MVCTTSAPNYYQPFTNGVHPMCTSSALCVTLCSVSTVRTARTSNSKDPQQKYRLGTVSIKTLGGLNRFNGIYWAQLNWKERTVLEISFKSVFGISEKQPKIVSSKSYAKMAHMWFLCMVVLITIMLILLVKAIDCVKDLFTLTCKQNLASVTDVKTSSFC